MKKHNDGYTLVLVLVVLVTLSLLATAVLSAGMRNLESQQSSVEYMQDKYAAQGQIEQLLSGEPVTLAEGGSVTEDGENIIIVVQSGNVRIQCEMRGTLVASNNNEYQISVEDAQYISYEISMTGGGNDENAG